jgi:tRNA pseudouridine38-40 synthase
MGGLTRLFELPDEGDLEAGGGAPVRRRRRQEEEQEPARAAPSGPLRRVVLQVAYDGSGFHGFARQPRARTVAGELAEALGRMCGTAIDLVCAGRTDTGVHATGQVVHADLPESMLVRRRRRLASDDAAAAAAAGAGGSGPAAGDPGGGLGWLARSLSTQLGPEIAVRRADFAPEGFDARHSAIARRYRYDVLNVPAADPLLARTTWHRPRPLDLGVMRLACDTILGEHDFTAFCRRPVGAATDDPIRRRVFTATWSECREPAGVLRFEIEANAFCHQMVRSLVGAHVAAGEGRMTAADVGLLLRSADRTGAPTLAPAAGLCLVAVRYPPELAPPA